MTDGEQLKANTYYRRCYEDALAVGGITDGKRWEELTDDQRRAVRDEVIRHGKEMDDFGRQLSEGAGR